MHHTVYELQSIHHGYFTLGIRIRKCFSNPNNNMVAYYIIVYEPKNDKFLVCDLNHKGS